MFGLMKAKSNTRQVLSIFLFLALAISACTKGEEDPFISFRSRKAKLTGQWVATVYMVGAYTLETNTGDPWTYRFDENGRGTSTVMNNIEKYKWEFLDGNDSFANKERILITNDGENKGDTITLIRLTNEEMKWRFVKGGVQHYVEFLKQE
jgi:hypothetical protein